MCVEQKVGIKLAITRNTSVDFVTFTNGKYIVKATYEYLGSVSALLYEADTLEEAQDKALKYLADCIKTDNEIHNS